MGRSCRLPLSDGDVSDSEEGESGACLLHVFTPEDAIFGSDGSDQRFDMLVRVTIRAGGEWEELTK